MNGISFNALSTADLTVDALYKGGTSGNSGDDPISKLLGVGNQGGFRYSGSMETGLKYVVLYSSLNDRKWPDELDLETGLLSYYGDNKKPGKELHDTNKKGNKLLRKNFKAIHTDNRLDVPPFFFFSKGKKRRDVIFRGLAVPGARGITEDLIAIWKTEKSQRFQNYKAIFTILDVPTISRAWLNDLANNNPLTDNAPAAWKNWVKKGVYTPLITEESPEPRTKIEQLPDTQEGKGIIKEIRSYFKKEPTKFEECAAELFKLMEDEHVVDLKVTRARKDGGMDAVGKYRIGDDKCSIKLDFALEAKCTKGSLGVKQTSRLLSRIRHRPFGVFVTTSYIGKPAYKEIIEDKQPLVIISARDIVEILRKADKKTPKEVKKWLQKFPT